MRLIVFFDLPTETSENKREYRNFRKFLLEKGFMMMQESVYSKIALNQTVVNSIIHSVKSNKPSMGVVQLLVITEKQFARMEYICGAKTNSFVDSDERVVIL